MDRETLEDRAIFATDGSLESDCAAFRRPDQGHRVSLWVSPAAEAAQRRVGPGELQHVGRVGVGPNQDGPPTYVLGENGQKRELARPQTLMQQRL